MSALSELYQEIALCQQCQIAKFRTKVVPGEGAEDAEILFIGEAPGWHEDQQGRPFVGPAGQYLDELLAQAWLKRPEVWIGNVVKCRPPGNRDPLPEELAACDKYLERQIAAISPKTIITLGRYSMGKYMPGVKISAVHGQMRRVGERFVIAMFHPAAALHQAALKPAILKDFAQLPTLLEQARSARVKSMPASPEEPQGEPKQMGLF